MALQAGKQDQRAVGASNLGVQHLVERLQPELRDVVAQLAVGEAKSAGDALKRHLMATGQAPVKVDLDPVEAAFKALREAWSRAPKAAKRRFVEEHFPEMEALAHDLVSEDWAATDAAPEIASDVSEIAAQ